MNGVHSIKENNSTAALEAVSILNSAQNLSFYHCDCESWLFENLGSPLESLGRVLGQQKLSAKISGAVWRLQPLKKKHRGCCQSHSLPLHVG